MPITKDMAKSTSRWMKVRDEFEKGYDLYDKEHFLDYLTTAYISKEVDMELALKQRRPTV